MYCSDDRSSMTRRCNSPRPRTIVSLVPTGWFDAQARVFRTQLLQNLPQALLVAPARRFDRQTIDGRGEIERGQVDVAVLGGVVQNGIEADLVHLGRGADIARTGLRDIHVLLALQQHQMGDERLTSCTDIERWLSRLTVP